jgi:hypothetical protein
VGIIHVGESRIILEGFGTVVNALGERCKPYLKQITATIQWRLNNKAAPVRMQAADLIGRIAIVMKACGEDQLMGYLGVFLYEYLGQEYPEVLGSIVGALRDWNDEDDTTGERSPPAPHSHPEKPKQERARECYRPCWSHC